MSSVFTHAARYRVADVDAAGLWAFAVEGNHCPCEAVRFGGAVVYQCTGFDGPHEVTEYHVVRESDGVRVDLWTAGLDDGDEVAGFAPFVGGQYVDDPRSAADAIARALATDGLGGVPVRLRFDPHPPGSCAFCA